MTQQQTYSQALRLLVDVPCGICGDPTPMTITKRCDRCWELEKRMRLDRELARKILASIDAEAA